MSDQRITLPDGETVNVSFVGKGGEPVRQPVEPTTPPPTARVQPAIPPNVSPYPSGPPKQFGGPPVPIGPVSDGTQNLGPAPAPRLPEVPENQQLMTGGGGLSSTAAAAVAVPGPTGTPVEVDDELKGQLIEGTIGHADAPMGQMIEVGDNGLEINGHRLPEEGLLGPVRVEHIDHDDRRLKVTVSYIAERETTRVQQDLEKQMLIEEVPHHEGPGGCTCQLSGQTQRVVDLINKTRRVMKRFVLQRDRDDTGVSGTGVVAEGVQLSDGRVVIRWFGPDSSIVIWGDMGSVLRVHGHKGATRLRWLDSDS